MVDNKCLVLVFVTFFVAFVSASDIDFADEPAEGRTVFTSGGTYYLALNTTYLIYYGILLSLLLLALLALSGLGGSDTDSYGAPPSSGYGHSQSHYYHQRQKRGFFHDNGRSKFS